jgi:hypothetical protein
MTNPSHYRIWITGVPAHAPRTHPPHSSPTRRSVASGRLPPPDLEAISPPTATWGHWRLMRLPPNRQVDSLPNRWCRDSGSFVLMEALTPFRDLFAFAHQVPLVTRAHRGVADQILREIIALGQADREALQIFVSGFWSRAEGPPRPPCNAGCVTASCAGTSISASSSTPLRANIPSVPDQPRFPRRAICPDAAGHRPERDSPIARKPAFSGVRVG